MTKKENKQAENTQQTAFEKNVEFSEKIAKFNDRQAEHAKAEAREDAEARGMHRDYDKFEEERVAQVEANERFEKAQVQERVAGDEKEERAPAEEKEYTRENFENSHELDNPKPLSTEANESGGLDLARRKGLNKSRRSLKKS